MNKTSIKDDFGWRWLPLWGALVYTIVRLPFINRYDLWFGSHVAVNYLQVKRILDGEIPLYFWGQDYFGTFTQLFVALFFLLFGSSIPLANFINVLIWASGAAFAVAYVQRAFGRQSALLSGLALIVSVPWFLHYEIPYFGSQYNLAALILFFFLWMGLSTIENPTTTKIFILGLSSGFCFYLNKLVIIPALAVSLVCVATKDGRTAIKKLLSSRYLTVCVLAFLLGYLPELLFKLGNARRHDVPVNPTEAYPRSHDLMGIATPTQMLSNAYWLARVMPAYFDADPLWRRQSGVHYLEKMENQESIPESVGDIVSIGIGFLVIGHCWWLLKRSIASRNRWQMAIMSVPFINALLVIAGGVTNASYYNSIRYIFPGGVVLLISIGLLLDFALRRRRWVIVALIIFLLGRSMIHRYQLLSYPDELHDFKKLVADLQASNIHYGATWFSYAHVLTALSDEAIVFASIDRDAYRTYLHRVMAQEELAFVYPTFQPQLPPYIRRLLYGEVQIVPKRNPTPGPQLMLWNQVYVRLGEPRQCGELSWCLIRKASVVGP